MRCQRLEVLFVSFTVSKEDIKEINYSEVHKLSNACLRLPALRKLCFTTPTQHSISADFTICSVWEKEAIAELSLMFEFTMKN
ncbi:hypothetical protein AN958_02246 [Leucoagaricus sp. SymC.cos]|nr:hypothetical protein AN958_02246 [Leucoagaricus sp. SymC.cos]